MKHRTRHLLALLLAGAGWPMSCDAQAPSPPVPAVTPAGLTYPIVDTNQTQCYDDRRAIEAPQPGEPFFGQDGSYLGYAPQYRDNQDGTISDLITGLMWTADPGRKVTVERAEKGAGDCRVGGHSDWRLPSVKELYSLIDFTGMEPDVRTRDASTFRPYMDKRYFKFQYGSIGSGERMIDSQWATTTRYVGIVLHKSDAMFGVNFADGRIKGYPIFEPRYGEPNHFYRLYVRGNPAYGINDFVDNGDGTVTDRATGLTWMQVDSGHLHAGDGADGKLNWQQALAWAENLQYAGHDDWRLPNIKELHSIVDYSRSPTATNSPAIDPIFKSTGLVVEENAQDYGYYWSGTSHPHPRGATEACYIAFGRAFGYFKGHRGRDPEEFLDVHGAGAQRCDEKAGDVAKLPRGRGPQGDVLRIFNLVRCVRGGEAKGAR